VIRRLQEVTPKEVLLVSLIFYFLACITPALVVENQRDGTYTLLGFLCLWNVCCLALIWPMLVTHLPLGEALQSVAQVAPFFANLLYGSSLYFLVGRRWKTVLALSIAASISALGTLTFCGQPMPLDYLNCDGKVLYCHMGFYLWLASMLIVVLQSWSQCLIKSPGINSSEP
jgi:hypothetical protein